MNRFHWHHSLTPLSHQDHIDRLKKLMINTFMFLLFFRKNKPSQRGKEWNSSLQVSHFSPIMLALQLHFPSLSHFSVNDPSTLQTQARFLKWVLNLVQCTTVSNMFEITYYHMGVSLGKVHFESQFHFLQNTFCFWFW